LEHFHSANQTNNPSFALKQRNQSRKTIQELCTDICANVPYFFGQNDQNDTAKPGVGAFEVMWALFTCACMHSVPEGQRVWAISLLENIGHGMAVGQALPLVTLIRSETNLFEPSGVLDPG
jgi:hypothetical protein